MPHIQVNINKVGEKILLRHPFSVTRVPLKRHVIPGIILGFNKLRSRYRVLYKDLKHQNDFVRNWIGVEYITSTTVSKEKVRRKRVAKPKLHTKKTSHPEKLNKIVMTHEDYLNLLDNDDFPSGISVVYDPSPDGNCQFEAIAHQMQFKGIHRSATTLRKEATEHLNQQDAFYRQFVHNMTYEEYVSSMARDCYYGINLTLVALMREYNMQCIVISPQGRTHTRLISNDEFYDRMLPVLSIAHFPEDNGMHYVSVELQRNILIDYLSDFEQPDSTDKKSADSDLGEASAERKHEKGKKSVQTQKANETETDNVRKKMLSRLHKAVLEKRSGVHKKTIAFQRLPLHIQIQIVKYCLNDPSFRFVLERTHGYFRSC
ncbi:uncharacterized protein LOC132716930 [Ruditapes philippinarum]|uniref:uncharacterized protein LOC132716930 n=1 Tax=Ruditapes philippinarum TaxID=129788 RepID=UPI00295B66F8|nr:uncharacterized protein LOC132716930 [Ruditapes philippinarum]